MKRMHVLIWFAFEPASCLKTLADRSWPPTGRVESQFRR